jgi:transposase-like protein
MRQKYHNRQEIVHRLSQPGSPSIAVISEETGVPKATLYAWLASEKRSTRLDSSPKGRLAMTKRSKPRSPSVKFELVADSRKLQGEALLAFCNEKGVTVEELLSWRDLALSGIEVADRDGLGSTRKEHDKRVTDLEAELRRKNDALAEAAALIILQKKISGLLDGQK